MLNQPFFQITLPIMIIIWAASWAQNKRLDEIIGLLARLENAVDVARN